MLKFITTLHTWGHSCLSSFATRVLNFYTFLISFTCIFLGAIHKLRRLFWMKKRGGEESGGVGTRPKIYDPYQISKKYMVYEGASKIFKNEFTWFMNRPLCLSAFILPLPCFSFSFAAILLWLLFVSFIPSDILVRLFSSTFTFSLFCFRYVSSFSFF